MAYATVNPTTGQKVFEIPYASDHEVAYKFSQAQNAFRIWNKYSVERKRGCFAALARILETRKDRFAAIDVLEMGMPMKDAVGDVLKAVGTIRYFGENFERLLAPKPFEEGGIRGHIRYEPLGGILCVAPWNFPFNQAIRSVIPNLAAGNVVFLKHASNVPQAAMALEAAFKEAGFPDGTYTNLFIPSSRVESVIAHPLIAGVALTGGDAAGRAVGALAGKYLKPSVLELGGSDPFIVLDTLRLDEIVKYAVNGRMSNCGQKCNSSKRFIVLSAYYAEFCRKFAEAMSRLNVGDPSQSSTEVGPLATESMLLEIESQVNDSVVSGATLLTGGKRVNRPGFFFEPTVLADVRPGMRAFDEETFGPVAAVTPAASVEEAIELANASRYGLGCSVFGDQQEQIDEVVSRIQAGNVAVNRLVTSYAFLPYGGMKDAGYGKELGERGIKAFVNEKVVVG